MIMTIAAISGIYVSSIVVENSARAYRSRLPFRRFMEKNSSFSDKSVFSLNRSRYWRSIIRKYASKNQKTAMGMYAISTYL